MGEWTGGLVQVFQGQPKLFLLACVVAFLIIGLALDAGPALLLLAPVLLPVSRSMGVGHPFLDDHDRDRNDGAGVPPPVGICLFVACKIGNGLMRQLNRELWPFLAAESALIILMVYVPEISNGLPRLIRGG